MAGIAAGGALAGAGFWATRKPLPAADLGPQANQLLRAVAVAVLGDQLRPQGGASLDAWTERFAGLVNGLPPHTQAELADLFTLLGLSAGRLLVCGQAQEWPGLPVQDLRERLSTMRYSALGLRQQAYHALRDLTHAAFYAHPDTWSGIGYEGPTSL